MDPSRNSSIKGFLSPQVMGIIGVLLGIILGLVYTWLISPVELIDLSIPQLRDDLKTEYLRIAIDSYAVNKDAPLAITRYDRIGKHAETYLAEIEFNPAGQSKSDIAAFRNLVLIPSQGEGSQESSSSISAVDILKWGLFVFILVAAALVIRVFLKNRSISESPQKVVIRLDQASPSELKTSLPARDLESVSEQVAPPEFKAPPPPRNQESTSEQVAPPEFKTPLPSQGQESVIEVNKLTKYYGKARGILDVSLNVYEGEIFGFIGPNGAGKSTTIRLFLSLIYPTSGEAKIFGKDCIKHGPEIRQEIGYLPSEVFYYEGMKVLDLLKYSASFYKKDCTDRIYELAEIMELDLDRRIDDLSYGNKKKVGIVQGLLHQPKLIILDEPTSGLDPLMQQKFFNLIKEENQLGATVFFSSHILGEVQKLCSRVAIIKEGSIINIQDIKSLQKDNYKKIRVVAGDINLEMFQVDGVTNLSSENGAVSFLYKGDINRITRIISHRDLIDISIEEPTLEEIFMHYYE